MSDSFVVKKAVRRKRRKRTETPSTPIPPEHTKHSPGECILPEYLINPPENHLDPGILLEPGHVRELVCSYRVAKEVLGSSFRPRESNLAIGKIRL